MLCVPKGPCRAPPSQASLARDGQPQLPSRNSIWIGGGPWPGKPGRAAAQPGCAWCCCRTGSMLDICFAWQKATNREQIRRATELAASSRPAGAVTVTVALDLSTLLGFRSIGTRDVDGWRCSKDRTKIGHWTHLNSHLQSTRLARSLESQRRIKGRENPPLNLQMPSWTLRPRVRSVPPDMAIYSG